MICRLILLSFFIFPTNLLSHNIATINLNKIYEKSIHFTKFMEQLSDYKQVLEKEIRTEEEELLNSKNYIENNKYILNEDEIVKLTTQYEIEFNTLQKKLDDFNNNISQNISNSQKILNKEIIMISKQISSKNNFSLILENTNFFIASDQIDISENIIEILNDKNIILNITSL